jgi:hypothetical protein
MHFITCYVIKYISLQRVCYRVWVTRIDVQRAGPVRPWPARAGPGQPDAGRYGLRATRAGSPTDTGRALGPWPGPWVI